MATRLQERISEKRDRASEVARELLGSSRRVATEPAADGAGYDGPDVRTCTLCGKHVPFRIDPLGSWAECTACGRLN
jgi:hypothetical protein